MPLLGKEPFVRKQLPPNLNPEDQIFFCKTTREPFLTYDEFFERQILCSSMVWTCSITGRTGLTYDEALQSERSATQLLDTFPAGLQIPVLYLMRFIDEYKFGSIVDMIYTFVINRYFIAEEIEIIINTKRRMKGKVFRVIPPTDKEINKCEVHSYGVDPDLFKYEIIDNEKNRHIVDANRVQRTKSLLTKDKIRLFLKQHLTQEKRTLPMNIKVKSYQDFYMKNIQWSHIFAGPLPLFHDDSDSEEEEDNNGSDSKRKSSDKKQNTNQKSSDSKKSNNKTSNGGKPSPKGSPEDKESLREKKLEQKKVEREQKRLLEESLKEWNAKRDDLSCDDLRPLPEPIPLNCKIPVELFADSVLVMEFLHNFNNLFDIKPIFPLGLNLELMEQILFDVDLHGPFGDFIKILLTSNMTFREDEEEESTQMVETSDDEDRPALEEERNERYVVTSGDKNANYFQNWIESHLGLQLSELSLDPLNITEVLRLYLLSSGGGREPKSNYRGLYNSREDPSIEFVAENELILTKLKFDTLFDLNPEERLKIMKVLIHQLLTFFEFREQIDDTFDEIAKQRKTIRDIQTEFNKWTKDNALKKIPNKKDSQNENQKEVSIENPTTEQWEEYRKERANKEEVMRRDCEEVRTQLRKLQACYGLKPIGCDRAFRKYWVFESLPGLFVEHMKPNTKYTDMPFGPCLERPTPNKSLKPNSFSEKTDLSPKSLRDDSSTTSDKENESALNSGSKSTQLSKLTHFDRCTANLNTCAVHGLTKGSHRTEWTFYYSMDHLNGLIEGLNCRGFRESELMCALNRDRNLILDYMNKCQPNKLNEDIPAPEARRSHRLHNVLYSRKGKQSFSGSTPNDAIVSALREYLISLEERIFAGSLAVVTELSRDGWKQLVERESHNKQELIKYLSKAILILTKSIRPMCLSAPLSDENNVFQNWSQSLCESTGLSQLFVHLSILEQSIKWSKSALKACCKICRRKCDAENMLLCDRCNRGHHTYCLQPALDSIPTGEWLCPDCLPKFKPQTPKKDKSFSKPMYDSLSECDTSDVEDSANVIDFGSNSGSSSPSNNIEICAECQESDSDLQLSCAKCHNYYHLSCANVRRVTRSDWFCMNCSNSGSDQRKRRQNVINIDINEDSISNDSQEFFQRRYKKSRYSQDFDYFDGKSLEIEEKVTPNTSTRSRSDKSSAAFRRTLPLDFGLCEDIIKQLQRHNDGWLFMSRPNHAPNYNKVIKEYIDFGQLVSKLNNMSYNSNLQFFRDVLLMLNNALFYNPIDSLEYMSCQSMAQYFEQLLKKYGFDLKHHFDLNF